jgi:hypothetical protein
MAHAANVAHVVLIALLALASITAAALARSALRYRWAQRAGLPYELPVRHFGTALRTAGAATAAATALAVAAALPAAPDAAPPAVARFAAAPVHAPARSRPAPPAPEPPAAPPRTIGHPAHGTLQRLADGTRVWLPPQYAYRKAAHVAFPVVVAYASASGADDRNLFEGFAAHVAQGLADPFVLVLPARCEATARDARAPSVVARRYRYRVVPGQAARGVLGVGDGAACAVRDAWAHPDRYRAAVGVSGTYPARLPPGSGTDLLLATASGDEAARLSARRFREALRGRHGRTEIRVTDGAGQRSRVFGAVAGYLTEKLTGPDRIHS